MGVNCISRRFNLIQRVPGKPARDARAEEFPSALPASRDPQSFVQRRTLKRRPAALSSAATRALFAMNVPLSAALAHAPTEEYEVFWRGNRVLGAGTCKHDRPAHTHHRTRRT